VPDPVTIEDLQGMVGQHVGKSDWVTIDQKMISDFADVTIDHQFIHVDPERARNEAGMDSTIAHGFLTLSLLSYLNAQILPPVQNRTMTLNYGMNKLRFLTPVAVDSRVRSSVTLDAIKAKSAGQYLVQFSTEVEIEGGNKPALVAEQLALYVFSEGG